MLGSAHIYSIKLYLFGRVLEKIDLMILLFFFDMNSMCVCLFWLDIT